MGIEPMLSAWEADVLPLNYTRWKQYYMQLFSGCQICDFSFRLASKG